MKSYRRIFGSCIYFFVLIVCILKFCSSALKQDIYYPLMVNAAINQEAAIKAEKPTPKVPNREEPRKKVGPIKSASIKDMPHNPLENRNLINSKNVTILMYHYITEGTGNYMSISKKKFKEQMQYLKDNEYNVISLDELYSCYIAGTPVPDNAVVITFDDGYADNYLYAYPILKELGFKATIFVITSKIDQYLFLTTRQIKELDANGISIESHTVSHPELNKLTYEEQFYELNQSRITLQSILGREIKYVAYPYGQLNKNTIKIANELNYKIGVTTVPLKTKKSNGLFTLNRIAVKEPIDIENFKDLLSNKWSVFPQEFTKK